MSATRSTKAAMRKANSQPAEFTAAGIGAMVKILGGVIAFFFVLMTIAHI